ncbi:glycosyltransferase family 2 protein [Lamprobacter modestohalophilus]|uniref:glycosyltransferase family 2 protein n=1 Tax=Lamprobacter modestohalophilus TaxID=1064514 RepID=UPI002ADEF94C|nr:glycosyltransferase family 2 protein [Lamprobacter modestohalophilus]MEA1052537.1 glycosyltransferase family 2 protein [Lamprobacter modestohalophilus]
MIAVIVIHYKAIDVTLACLESLQKNAGCPFHLFVVANESDEDSQNKLNAFIAPLQDSATLIINCKNIGFAAGCNQALEIIISDPAYQGVALLNNDTLVAPGWLSNMSAHLLPEKKVDMVASQMLVAGSANTIDSLGIVFYKTGIGSNRKDITEPMIGPCGGAALYSSAMLRHLREVAGYCFDEDFFCYAEDTDLALRARALGYDCAFAREAIVYHYGSHASGGSNNTFVAYYGLRNSLFALIKNLPSEFLARNIFWIFSMQIAVTVKYILKRKPKLIFSVYADFLHKLPRILKQRAQLKQHSDWKPIDWRMLTSRRFYELGYIGFSLRTLLHMNMRDAS